MAKTRADVKRVIEESYLEILKDSFKENLLSVMIYGSYVSGDFLVGVSDVNILIILDSPLNDQIQALGTHAHKLMKRYRITPLILTRSEFINSADVFPMEYFDIKDRNTVLYGNDETTALTLKRTNLRHQLEERLRGTITSLRQVIIASAGRKKILEGNMKILFGSLKALFRGLLRLKKMKNIPVEGEKIIEELNKNFGIKGEPFLKLLELRKGGKIAPDVLAGEVLAALEELIRIVDKMDIRE